MRLLVIGAGPAGLTAGLYCAQAGLKVLALERETMGGQIMNIEKIENYPGFADGVSGAELGQAMMLQAMNYGLGIQLAEVQRVELRSENKQVKIADGDYWSKAVVLAGGASYKNLACPGRKSLWVRTWLNVTHTSEGSSQFRELTSPAKMNCTPYTTMARK